MQGGVPWSNFRSSPKGVSDGSPLSNGDREAPVSGVLSNIEACVPALHRYASALLHSREDGEDLVHDTLVQALDRLHTRRGDGDIRAWLFAIMHNLFITQTRRATRWRAWFRESRPPPDQHEEIAADPSDSPEDALRWRELMRALNGLPAEQRAIILLVSVEDLSYAEVARVLGIPIGTVMSRLARGREQLRRAVREQEEPRPGLRRVK
jgi:RNA polymerase sigma-70 factor (ECF subfamily)